MASSGSATDAMSGLGGGLGSLIGYWLGAGDRQKQADDYNRAINSFKDVDPNVLAQQAGSSAFNDMHTDPSTRANMSDVLQRLRDTYSNGGLDARARADQAATQAAANRNTQAQEAAIRNEMAQRGLSNSGANYAAQRSAAQNSNNALALQELQAQAMGEQRAQGALQGAGQLAGQMRSQDYEQAATRAAANDAINRFNASQRQGAEQDTAGNSLARAGGVATGYTNEAGNYGKQAQKTQELGYGVGSGVGGMAGYGMDQAQHAADDMSGGGGGGSGGGGGGGGLSGLFSMFGG